MTEFANDAKQQYVYKYVSVTHKSELDDARRLLDDTALARNRGLPLSLLLLKLLLGTLVALSDHCVHVSAKPFFKCTQHLITHLTQR